MLVEYSQDLMNPAWDSFVANQPFGQYEQSSKWAELKSIYGWRPIRFSLIRGGEILGGAQILTRRLPLIGGIGYVTKGPLYASNEPALLEMLVHGLCASARKYRLQYLIVQPPDNADGISSHFVSSGFRTDTMVDMVDATTVIDLRPDIEEIFRNMSKNNRRFIRHAERKGISVLEGSEEDIGTFFLLMLETCKRQGVAPNPPDAEFLHKLWRVFNPDGHAKLFLAAYRGEVISGVFAIPYGNVVRAWKLGWSGAHGDLKPNQLLFWEMIKWAKDQGYRYFDFVSVDRTAAEKVLEGAHFSRVATGHSFFKLMFGGQVRLLPTAYSYIYNPFLRAAYARIGPGLMHWSVFRKLVFREVGFLPIAKPEGASLH